MELAVIKIGNSKGIRLTKVILRRYQIAEKVELEFRDECIILKSVVAPRSGWQQAFRNMHEKGDDHLLMEDVFDDENFKEWT